MRTLVESLLESPCIILSSLDAIDSAVQKDWHCSPNRASLEEIIREITKSGKNIESYGVLEVFPSKKCCMAEIMANPGRIFTGITFYYPLLSRSNTFNSTERLAMFSKYSKLGDIIRGITKSGHSLTNSLTHKLTNKGYRT